MHTFFPIRRFFNISVNIFGLWIGVLLLGLAGFTATARAQDKFIVMASTTSTEQSGLFSHLLPAFKQASGILDGVQMRLKIGSMQVDVVRETLKRLCRNH